MNAADAETALGGEVRTALRALRKQQTYVARNRLDLAAARRTHPELVAPFRKRVRDSERVLKLFVEACNARVEAGTMKQRHLDSALRDGTLPA